MVVVMRRVTRVTATLWGERMKVLMTCFRHVASQIMLLKWLVLRIIYDLCYRK